MDELTGSGIVQNNYGNVAGSHSGSSQYIEKLVVGVAGGSSTFGGVIRNNSAGTAPANALPAAAWHLEKAGGGTLTLAGANTYTGTTTVNAGTLALAHASTNNIAASPIITVAATLDVTALAGGVLALSGATGQRLQGSGLVLGTVTAPGATRVAPGTPTTTAVLTVTDSTLPGGVNLQPGSVLDIDVLANTGPGTGHDQLAVNGDVNLGGAPAPRSTWPTSSRPARDRL